MTLTREKRSQDNDEDCCRQSTLLTPEAQNAIRQLRAPTFDTRGKLLRGNMSPFLIGSSPTEVICFHSSQKNIIQTLTQLPKNQEHINLAGLGNIRKGWLGSMYVEPALRVPGIVLDPVNEKIRVNTASDAFFEAAAQVVEDYEHVLANPGKAELESILSRYALPTNTPAWQMLRKVGRWAAAVKGQQTGLFSWGLNVMDETGRPVIYNESAFEIISRALLLTALWQERTLRKINPNVIFTLDEPFLTQVGSSHISVPNSKEILRMQFELFKERNLGAHCCGQTEYGLLFHSSLNIVALDLTGEHWDGRWETANYAQSFVSAAKNAGLQEFFDRGGQLAYGVGPFNPKVSVEQIVAHVRRIEKELRARSIRIPAGQCLITPVCGGGGETPERAKHAFSAAVLAALELQKGH